MSGHSKLKQHSIWINTRWARASARAPLGGSYSSALNGTRAEASAIQSLESGFVFQSNGWILVGVRCMNSSLAKRCTTPLVRRILPLDWQIKLAFNLTNQNKPKKIRYQ